MGANSGPFTQRLHLFYPRRQDVITFLRVHAISGMMDLYDYAPAATGMTYDNDLNTGGATVDGQPETLIPGSIAWEMVTGDPGTVIISHSVTTDIDPFAYTSYYSDDDTPSVTQCTGDAFEYATSGLWIDSGIPNTDPYLGAHNILVAQRTVYYDAPGQPVATAAQCHTEAQSPLVATAYAYPPLAGDCNRDGLVDAADFPLFADCLSGAEVPVSTGCECADDDGDGDADLPDFAVIQRAFG
jgi:hypothetical protein